MHGKLAALEAALNNDPAKTLNPLFKSFLSLDSTLDGIRAVCALVDRHMLDSLEPTEVLELFYLVGLACGGSRLETSPIPCPTA